MACGLPVIASNVGGVSEIVKNGYNGFLYEPDSFCGIENFIIDLLKNESLRYWIGQNAMQTVKTEFSWSVNLKKYVDIYSNALGWSENNELDNVT